MQIVSTRKRKQAATEATKEKCDVTLEKINPNQRKTIPNHTIRDCQIYEPFTNEKGSVHPKPGETEV